MAKISLLCSIFFQCLRNLGSMAKIFLCVLSTSKKYMTVAVKQREKT